MTTAEFPAEPSPPAAASPVPGDRLPGDRLPGDRLPGDRLPGDRLPGDRPPGDPLRDDPLPGDTRAARHRLPARTLTYWRVRALINAVVIVALLTWWAVGADWFTSPVRWTVDGAAAVWFLVVGVLIRPIVRWKLFWYAVSDDEIDLQHGWLVQTRTVVPMNRVQHLKSERGLLAGHFRLAVLHIHTAAGPVVVDGLDQDDAAAMRIQIGRLARLSDDL